MKSLMIASAAVLVFSGVSLAQDKPKKEVKMEMKEMKHDAKIEKKKPKWRATT